MSCQLPADYDCLNKIFEYLEQDKVSLHSCLLVNRLWCEVSVRILWRDIWDHIETITPPYRLEVALQIFRILISCLPNESKDLLHENGIFITTPTRQPLFNYVSFFKVLSVHDIVNMIELYLEEQPFIDSLMKYLLISQEILKMLMKQISSLRTLKYLRHLKKDKNIIFTYFPGAKDCLTGLTELTCSSSFQPEFYYLLSQICHNIQSLTIVFGNVVSDGLDNLIHFQNNLTSVTLQPSYYVKEVKEGETVVIASSLEKFSSTIIKLKIKNCYIPFSFIATFKNIQELVLSFDVLDHFDDLQYVTFPRLNVLKFLNAIPKDEALIKFLEINGKNLKEFYMATSGGDSLYLAVVKFCPNLQTLSAVFLYKKIDTLKVILSGCQYLKSIKVWSGREYNLNEEEIFEVIAKHSQKNFHELKLDYSFTKSGLFSKDLEAFLISWNNRIPQRSLSLIVVTERTYLKVIDDENMKLIEKYKNLGIVKKFEIEKYTSR